MRGQEIVCPLAGEHQWKTPAPLAIALHELGYSPAGIAATRLAGKTRTYIEQPEIILDGAHNLGGTRALVQYIQRFYADRASG